MTEEKFEAQRVLVESFSNGSAVVEVWESRSRDGIKVFFDVRASRSFISGGERKRGPFIQQRDIGDLIISLVQAQAFIAQRHSEIRKARYAEEDRDLDGVPEGSYGEPEGKE